SADTGLAARPCPVAVYAPAVTAVDVDHPVSACCSGLDTRGAAALADVGRAVRGAAPMRLPDWRRRLVAAVAPAVRREAPDAAPRVAPEWPATAASASPAPVLRLQPG